VCRWTPVNSPQRFPQRLGRFPQRLRAFWDRCRRIHVLANSTRKPCILQGFCEWRDPDSNWGHHDFQASIERAADRRRQARSAPARGARHAGVHGRRATLRDDPANRGRLARLIAFQDWWGTPLPEARFDGPRPPSGSARLRNGIAACETAIPLRKLALPASAGIAGSNVRCRQPAFGRSDATCVGIPSAHEDLG